MTAIQQEYYLVCNGRADLSQKEKAPRLMQNGTLSSSRHEGPDASGASVTLD